MGISKKARQTRISGKKAKQKAKSKKQKAKSKKHTPLKPPKHTMDAINERIQSIRIGRNAPEKISSYLKYVDDAMKADLSDNELQKWEDIFAKVDRGFMLAFPKTKKSKKSTGGTKSTGDASQTPPRARKHTITGYGLFLKKACAELKEQKFSGNYLTQVSVLWRTILDDEKKEWYEKARVLNLGASESRETPDDLDTQPTTSPKVDLTAIEADGSESNTDASDDSDDSDASDDSDGEGDPESVGPDVPEVERINTDTTTHEIE